MSFLCRKTVFAWTRTRGAGFHAAVLRYSAQLSIPVALLVACGGESVCSNGACDEPLSSDAGLVASTAASTSGQVDDGGSVPTAASSSASAITDAGLAASGGGGSGGLPGLGQGGNDAGPVLDAAVGFGGTPHDGGPPLDASLDGSADAAADAQASSEAGSGDTECAECECDDDFDCMAPLPICGPGGNCIACDDGSNLGCSGDFPWCKAGVTFEDNTCVECRAHSDCKDDDHPACEADSCVVCSIADNEGCTQDAPLCVTSPDGNHCVQCVSEDDCSSEAPICDDSICIPCTTQENGEGSDTGCGTDEAPRCLEGAVPSENSCVECLSNPDCNLDYPYCAEDNSCVECLASDNCQDTAAPRCNGEGTCAGCESDDDCARFSETAQCDVQSGACVQCTGDDHCPNASAAACGEDFTCGACTSESDCEHLDGLGVCNSGQCVECTVQDESACGLNSCNPATNTCTNTPRGSIGTCETCAADSECNSSNKRCVPMTFQGTFHGNFCLTLKSAGCARPYLGTATATSVSGEGETDYCSISEELTTCEALLDLTDNDDDVTCSDDLDCGGGLGGLCRSIDASEGDKCTIPCGAAANCPLTYSCDGPDDSMYCQL